MHSVLLANSGFAWDMLYVHWLLIKGICVFFYFLVDVLELVMDLPQEYEMSLLICLLILTNNYMCYETDVHQKVNVDFV